MQVCLHGLAEMDAGWQQTYECMCSYIYEGAANGSANIASPADRIARTAQPEKEILSLLDYRTRYNQYNTDVGERSVGVAS
jgi:phosphodiesterase/alkaline phosphatase D-like protein